MTKRLTFQASQVGTQAKKILLILIQKSVSTRLVGNKCSVWAVFPQQMLWQSSLRAQRVCEGCGPQEAAAEETGTGPELPEPSERDNSSKPACPEPRTRMAAPAPCGQQLSQLRDSRLSHLNKERDSRCQLRSLILSLQTEVLVLV